MKRRDLPFINLVIAIVLLVIDPASVQAQSKKAMTIIDFLNIPGVGSAALSPNGNQLLYIKSESDWKKNRQIGHIWRKDINTGALIQLTNGVNGESNAAWSPNGEYISFVARREPAEANQVYLIRNVGGEARQFTKHETAVRNVQWAPDGQSIYFLASDPKSKEEKEKEKLKDDVYGKDENWKYRHLWKMGINDTSATRVTEGDYSVNSYQLSRDGKNIVIQRAISPLFGDSQTGEIWKIDADGGNAVKVTNNNIPESSARLSPDGSQISFYAFTNEQFEFYYNDKLFLVPSTGGTARAVTKNSDYEVNGAEWSADGKAVYVLMNTGVEMQLFKYTVSNSRLTKVTSGDFRIGGWRYYPNQNKHVFTLGSANTPGDIYLMNGDDFNNRQRLTYEYDYLDRDFQLPTQEKVTWKGADGEEVEGLLYLPANYQRGTRYPLVVQTHGGPASSDKYGLSRGFTRFNPVLAAHGYVVLQPNYRGSTGYGDDFLRDMVGSYFKNAHLDVMTGVDHLIKEGIVDGDRMVKMGWSAGGHMTNKIITHTDRFKAASSGAGAANWVSMYGQSDVRIYRTPWFGGTPWQENAPIDVYWEHSPLKYVSKVTTPTLFLVGGSDPRVPPPQSVEMFRALKTNGVETHLYIAPREPHGWQELRHRLYKINVELDWYAKHALGKEYTWEKAPKK